MKKRRARSNAAQRHRTVTQRRHVPHDEELSRRIHACALQQIAVRNRTTQHLVAHGPTPVRKSPKAPNALFAQFQVWRSAEPWLESIRQRVWRPAVEAAAAAYNAWEETNEEHARLVCGSSTPGDDKKTKAIPRRVQRRRPDPDSLYVSRKQRDRANRHTVRIDDGVKRLGDHAIHVPGIGTVPFRKKLGTSFDVRSVTIVERTPAGRGTGGYVVAGDRTWTLHIGCRKAAPLPKLCAGDIRSTGSDHGLTHALTTSHSDGSVRMLHYDAPEPASVREWNRRECLKARCKRGSRRWRKLTAEQASIRRDETNRRTEQRRAEANAIARSADIVGIEDLEVRNMVRSGRGTNEQPGRNVAAKRGLDRRLHDTAPGLQTAELMNACRRHAARYCLVPARNTSITCPRCGHQAKENRESQAGFRCRRCGHTANADVNAAENIRLAALAHYGVGVDRSPEPQSSEKSLSWGVAMTTARRKTESAHAEGPAARPTPKRHGPGDTTRQEGVCTE